MRLERSPPRLRSGREQRIENVVRTSGLPARRAGLGLAASVLAAMDNALAAYVVALLAGVGLLIGSIAQGLRVGWSAHCEDHQAVDGKTQRHSHH